jgi:hypothetical protein
MRGLTTMPTHRVGAAPRRDGRFRGAVGGRERDRRYTIVYPSTVVPAVHGRGFFSRLCRRAMNVTPTLTAGQQLRLLQLALNVKLKREGKPPDSIRLSLVEEETAVGGLVPVGPCATRPLPVSRPTMRAR